MNNRQTIVRQAYEQAIAPLVEMTFQLLHRFGQIEKTERAIPHPCGHKQLQRKLSKMEI